MARPVLDALASQLGRRRRVLTEDGAEADQLLCSWGQRVQPRQHPFLRLSVPRRRLALTAASTRGRQRPLVYRGNALQQVGELPPPRHQCLNGVRWQSAGAGCSAPADRTGIGGTGGCRTAISGLARTDWAHLAAGRHNITGRPLLPAKPRRLGPSSGRSPSRLSAGPRTSGRTPGRALTACAAPFHPQ